MICLPGTLVKVIRHPVIIMTGYEISLFKKKFLSDISP